MKKNLLTSFILFALSLTIAKGQCLSGTYTIGGTTPNYTTIISAVTALTSNGVCGPVVFNIRSGTYTEQITIPAITGTSSINTITFQSEALDSTSVTVQASSTVANNFVFKFNGVDNLKIHKIKVKNISTAGLYTCVFYVLNNSDNNEISNCILESPLSTTSNSTKSIILSGSSDNENYNIKNNVFTGGSFAINFSGSVSFPTFFAVKNNVFYRQYVNGIVLTSINSPVIRGNLFNYSSTISSFAIQLSACNDSSIISNNEINITLGGSGIAISNCTGNTIKNILISNNKINGGGNSNGISLNNAMRTKIYHNTVVCSGTITTAFCISAVNTGTTNIIKNNIFYQKGLGLVYTTSTSGFFVSDYNDVYTAGIKFAVYNGVNYVTCAAWKSGLNMDLNSTNYIPQFVSTSDFHISSDFSQNITFPYFTEVSADFEGTIREVNSPYFGAYEFFNNVNLLDASINRVNGPPTLNCVGSQQVKVLLKNYSATSLTSSIINWTINGLLQPVFNWTGNLNYYDTLPVAIGNLNFSNWGSYVIKAWASNPNGSPDAFAINDSATSPSLYTGLSGIYTVGGAVPDFNNLATALSNLNNRGICGSVTLNVRAGTYIESMLLSNIKGLLGANSLTIESETGVASSVTVYSNSSQNTFKLAGADNVVIKNITIGNASVAAPLVLLNVGSNNVEISNCILFGGGQYAIHGYLVAGTVLPSDIRILNNTFNTGSYNIRFEGSSVYWKFRNVKINNNVFNAPASGLMLVSLVDTLEFLNNRGTNVSGPAPNFSNVAHAVIKNNKFYTIDAYEISESIFANNMITCSGRSAVNIVNGSVLKFINNSINCFDANTGTPALSIGSMGSPLLGNKFWNNCIVNNGTGKLISSSDKLSFKKNVYYGGGSIFGTINGTDASDLNSWKSLSVSDTGSFLANPFYSSATDLHAHEFSLKNVGFDVSSLITDDYDAQPRDANPDIGADEFTPDLIDAGLNAFGFGQVVCSGSNLIQVYLKNNGSSLLTSATLKYKINSTLQPVYNWTGSLAAGAQTLVNIGTFNFLPFTTYSLTGWSYNPNSTLDPFTLNDTIVKTISLPALNGSYTIGGITPDFTTISNAVTALRNGGVCGPVVFNIRNGLYTEQLKIQNIKGVSIFNTIKFQSQGLDSSLVTIQYNASSSALNYTINIDTTDYVSFYKLGLKSLNSTYSGVLLFSNKATHCELNNCVITGPITGSGTLAIFQANSDTTLVSNNKFYNSSDALNIQGIYSRVLNNYFEGQSSTGISGAGSGLQYSSNTFNYLNSFSGRALYISGTYTDGFISKNKISVTGSGKAFYLTGGSYLGSLNIQNNFILMNGGTGIYLYGFYFGKILYNSVSQKGSSGVCFNIISSGNIISQNNIFCNTNNSTYCILYGNGNTFYSSNYNCIYSISNLLVNVNNTTFYNTLASYNLSSGYETNSISLDPYFISSTNLHVNNALLNAAATFNSNVPDDIDGDVRNLTTPDIGADEFNPVLITNDAQLLQLYLANPSCGGTKIVYAKIKNMGADTLHSVNLIASYQGVSYPSVIWNGSLAQGAIMDSITIATLPMVYGSGSLKGWTYSPNTFIDANTANDTLINSTTNIAMNGVFKIGGVLPDFSTLRQAVNAIKLCGICSNVIFDLRPGTYTDTLSISSIAGSAIFNIKFRSENNDSSSVIIQDFSSSPANINYIIMLDAARNISFENLTFKQNLLVSPSGGNYGILIKNQTSFNANDIKIANCRFIGTASSGGALRVNGANNLVNFQIKNSAFSGPANAIGIYNVSNGSFNISDNNFNNCSVGSINMAGYSGTTGEINNNRIVSSLTNSSIIGISLDFSNCNINHNIFLFKTGTALICTNSQNVISNNYIQIDSVFNPLYNAALKLGSANSTSQLVFNTIKTKILKPTDFVVFLYSSGNFSVKNNIFINNCNTGNIIYSTTNNTIDYNRYQTNSTNFGTYNSTNYSTFSAWKTATGNDINSQNQATYLSITPGYKIIGDYDLDGTGTPIAGITNDILNSLRNNIKPDIGAYEFTPLALDAGIKRFVMNDSILCAGVNSVTISVRNQGLTAISNVGIYWKVNNISQPVFNFSGMISGGDSAIVTVGNYNFKGGKRYYFEFYSSMPNGIADSSNYNDTLRTATIKARFSGIYTIGGSSPDFTTFKQAADTLQQFGVCGPVIFNLRNGAYTSNFTLTPLPGSSVSNKVTFQSETLDSSLVSIADNGVSIELNRVKNIRFNKLSFIQNSSLNYPTIAINDIAKNIEISNCSFSKPVGTVYGTIRTNFIDSISGELTIRNSLFRVNTSLEIASSTFSPNAKKILITHNNFQGVDPIGISNLDDLEYSYNINKGIVNITSSNQNLKINNNKITNGDLNISTGSLASSKNIFNNILDGGRLAITGSSAMNIFHNTIVSNYLPGFGSSAGCLSLSGSILNIQVKNNVFMNRRGYIIFLVNDPSFIPGTASIIYDNNEIYTSSDTIAYSTNNPNYISKGQWLSNFNQDHHSVFFEPQFTGLNDFHPLNDFHLNNVGLPNSIAISDYDGVARSPSNPDPGAYEFNLSIVPNDAGIQNYSATYCSGMINPVNVTLKNYGNNNLSNVGIHWSIAGISQPVYNWSGTLAPDSAILVTLGNFSPGIYSSNNFIFYTKQPNGNLDGNVNNDTLLVNGNLSSLNGTYTVGGFGANFNSFFDATTALLQRGICGPVDFIVNPGVYVNPGSFSGLNNIIGNTLMNTITFESQTGNAATVTIDMDPASSTDGIMDLNNITSLTFKNFSFIGAVNLGANAKSISFIGIKFNTNAPNFYTPNNLITSNKYNQDVRFINNYFSSTGTVFYYTHALGALYPKNLIIKGNTFDGAHNGIEINNVDSIVVDSNFFYRTGAIVNYSHAIRILDPKNHFEISRNVINGNFESGVELGIRQALSNLGSSVVSNNIIIGANSMYYGVITYCDSLNINYNSIRMNDADVPLFLASSENRIYNNILTSGIGKLIGRSSLTGLIQCDYNILYTGGPVLFVNDITNYNSIASYTSATGLEAHSFFHNPEFVSVSDLHYLNDTLNGKATPIASIIIDQQGHTRDAITPNPGAYETSADTVYDLVNTYLVINKILNDTLQIGNNPLTASIIFTSPPHVDTNYYHFNATVDSLRIHYKINDLAEISETWIGTLNFGDSLLYTFTNILNVPNGKLYDIKVWFENLNPLQSEINVADDSLHKIFILPMLGDYTIGGITPDFSFYSKVNTSLLNCGSIGNVRFLYRPGIYSENITYQENHSYPSHIGWLEFTSETGNPNDVKIRLNWLDDVSKIKFSKLTITPLTGNGFSSLDDGLGIYTCGITVFDSCNFIGGSNSNEKSGLFFKKQYGGVTSIITNCLFKNLKYAINISDYDSYVSSGSSFDFRFENNVIDSCIRGILIKEYNSGKKLMIKNNKITVSTNGIEVSGNGCTNLDLAYNTIDAGGKGLNFTVLNKYSLLINNMVNSGSLNYIVGAKNLKAYNNTFNRLTYFFNSTDSISLYNNIFYTDSTFAALQILYSTPLIISSDNNNYFAPNNSYIVRSGSLPYPGIIHQYTSVQQIRNTIFTDSNSVNFDPLFLSSTNLHSQSSNLKGLAKPFPFVTTDIDGESRLLNAPDIGADEINLIVTDVWPGDADKNNIVDNNDLLPIGLFYGQAGSPRANINNSWMAYPSMDWGIGQISGCDIKHIDCNGDGIINNNDTLAINLNFSLTHAIVVNNYSDLRTGDPAIYFITSSNSYNAGDWVNVEVWTGSSTIPVSNLYGIAFNINYDVSLVQTGTEILTYPNNTWLGTLGTNAITVAKTDPLASTSYGGITRIDHINMNGFGKVADFKFQVKTNLQSPAAFHFSISQYKANDATGLPIVFAPSVDSIVLYPLTTEVVSAGSIQEFTISPNPFSSQTTIIFSKEQKHTYIKIMDVLGKEIKTVNFTGKQLIIEKAEMQKGVYFVQLIDCNKNVVNRKIIVQ